MMFKLFIFIHYMQKKASIIMRSAFCCCAFVKLADIVQSCER